MGVVFVISNGEQKGAFQLLLVDGETLCVRLPPSRLTLRAAETPLMI